ncbi:MAG TPA: phage tail terminator-like protein [Bacteroidales bacterium]|nr:phage tail terminator-like protein [Bacteroidales bacterium]
MSDTWDDIEKAICEYIETNWTATPIQYPNQKFDPEAELKAASKTVWMQFHIIPVDDWQHIITGGNTGQMHRGILHFNLFILKNTGTGKLTEYIDDLRDLFNHHSITIGTHTLQFGVPKPQPEGPDGKWWRKPLKVEFEYLE